MIGKTVSHYKILEKLGEGGMGVVYKAEDTKLDRHVAIKFLPPHLQADEKARTRFIHEAKAASSLEHPHICAIHEINETPEGQTFIVMPCYKGETLQERLERGPLEIDEALEIASEVASALSKAHDAGMIHRDIKPGNIFVTADGVVKIMDFGLAKLAGQTKVTRTGMTLGTVAYMSPEQARGEEIDHRTDIWSLGVVLYEMLTGQQPFRGEYEPAVIYSIMNEEPEPVTSTRRDVPLMLEDIIEKTLAKDPVKRYQTMDELLTDLGTQRDHITLGIKERRFTVMRKFRRRKRLSVGVAVVVVIALAAVLIQVFYSPGMGIDSLAVLPFANLSGDEAQEYFADGMTESLISEVGQISALRVISRTSVMRFKQTDKSPQEIAQMLNVDAFVEASVARTADRIRIAASLYRVEPEEQLWSDTYNREGRDVAIVLSEVTRAIADRIEVALTPEEEERLTRVRTVDPEAYDAYLKGRYHANALSLYKAIEHLKRAIDIDPTYALAYSALADCYSFLCLNTLMPHDEAAPKAIAAVKKALELDDGLGDAHGAYANTKFLLEWDWWGPDESFKRAIELSPNSWKIHMDYSTYLAIIGRGDEAIAQVKRAIELDPLAPTNDMLLIWTYYIVGRYDEAIAEGEKRFGETPELVLAWAYAKKQMYKEAVAQCDSLIPLFGKVDDDAAVWVDVVGIGTIGGIYGMAGKPEKAREMLALLMAVAQERPVDAYYVACLYDGLGDRDKTLEWLERAYDDKSPSMMYLKGGFSHLAGDPRYQDLLQRVGIPPD